MDGQSLEFLDRYTTGVLCSTARDGSPRACTVYYILDASGPYIVYKSRTQSEHALFLAERPLAAMAVYRHDSGYATKAGIQMKGRVERVRDRDEMARYVTQYSARFLGASEHFDPVDRLLSNDVEATMFRFLIEDYKLTDGWSDRLDLTYQPARPSASSTDT